MSRARDKGSAQTSQLRVNGVDLTYLEQGTGIPVVFVHGAFSDHRFWEPQRQAVAASYRFIAITQRYFGSTPWPDDGQHYAATTHAADLAAFLRHLNIGPVHLVGLSYGGTVAALVAVAHPEMLRSLALAEPGLGTLLADIPEAKRALEEWTQARQSLLAEVKAAEVTRAVKRFFELVNHQGSGSFEKQPDLVRQIFLDNARTVPLALAAPPPSITCAMLSSVAVPTLVVGGAQTLPFFALVNEVAVRCIPGSRSVSIPQATHPMSYQNPAAFNEALLQFLAQH